MDRIIGVNEARPKLGTLIEDAESRAETVIITINSEPRGVLIGYKRFCQLSQAEKDCKKLALKLAMEKIRSRAAAAGITFEDIREEVRAVRDARKSSRS